MSAHTMLTALSRSVPLEREKLGAPYLEIQASYAVHNRYLRIAVFALLGLLALMATSMYKLVAEYAARPPIVVRVNPEGDAVTAPYASLAYQPREPEIRHFLMNFTKDHYSRIRVTARDAFQRKLFFLGASLARAVMEHENEARELQTFLTGNDDEVEVYVTNVAIEDLRTKPYKASAVFEKVFRAAGSGRELKREKYTAHFVFTLLDKIPANFIEMNPLGLVIQYFREDQAF